MKKKLFIHIFLSLVCILVLSGCACQHEWQDADCLTAKTCTKCEETEGTPLGHDWLEATCTAPETCSRCGETQAEKLEHTYGDWIMGKTDMSRTCQNCGDVESAEIDRELYLKQKLEGHWDFLAEQKGDEAIYAHQLRNDLQAISLHIDQANGSWLRNPLSSGEIFEIAPEFLEYQEADGVGYYYFSVTLTSDNSMIVLAYVDLFDQVILVNGDTITTLAKNTELENAVAGLWADVNGENVTTLELNENRTFTASVSGEEYAGTWHLRSISYYTVGYGNPDDIYQQAGLDLIFEENGKTVVKSHTLYLGMKDDPLESTLRYSSFSLQLGKNSVSLNQMDAESLQLLKDANMDGPERILGQWSSTVINTYTYSTSQSSTNSRNDFSITFAEDGTFQGNLDKEYTGTWEFRDASMSGDSIYYYYWLKFDGIQKQISANIGYKGELSISDSDNDGSYSVNFAQLTEEQKATLEAENEKAKTRIIGDWNSCTIYQDSESTINTDYTICFSNDGTFTTNLEEGTTGTWCFEEVDINKEYNITTYRYSLTMEGFDGHASAYIQNEDDLSVSLYKNSKGRSVDFAQLSAEELAAIAEAPNLIPGTWSGKEISRYNEETEEFELVRMEAHTITISTDGTYTSTLPQIPDGTWSFWKIDEYGTGYSFKNGDHGSIYRINADGLLEVWFEENGEMRYIDMSKE